MKKNTSFKSGYIAILGLPNVGKSTLLNAILGEKISIVSSKPQTTRHKILGIHNTPKAQLLFLDTAGLHSSDKILNYRIVQEALGTLEDADLVYFVTEPFRQSPSEDEMKYLSEIEKRGTPYFLIFNKIDQVPKPKLLPVVEAWQKKSHPKEIFFTAASLQDGIADLVEHSIPFLPEGPAYYPDEQLTDRDLRYLSSEIIREKLFELTHQEIPYSTAVVIDEFIEETDRPLDRISATIYVEKDSQKPIVIGKGGVLLKKIGQFSRIEIEKLTGRKVFLTLFVKVVKDWTRKEGILKDLGF